MFTLFGFPQATAERKSKDVFRFETMLALISKSNVELRDPKANYNKMTLKQFDERYPNIGLVKLSEAEGVDTKYIQEMVVGQPAFFEGLDKIVALRCV